MLGESLVAFNTLLLRPLACRQLGLGANRVAKEQRLACSCPAATGLQRPRQRVPVANRLCSIAIVYVHGYATAGIRMRVLYRTAGVLPVLSMTQQRDRSAVLDDLNACTTSIRAGGDCKRLQQRMQRQSLT